MISEGKHKARAVSGEYGYSKNKGTPYVQVTFEIVDGDAKNETCVWNGYFTEATEERTIESLRACGCSFPGNDVTNLDGVNGCDVQIVINHEPWTDKNGEEKMMAKVQWVNRLARGIPDEQKMDAAKKAAFKAKMAGKVLLAKKRGGDDAAPVKASPQRDPTDYDGYANDRGGDDGLPF